MSGEAFNFGPSSDVNHTVEELILEFAKSWEDARWDIQDTYPSSIKESMLLKLNCDKAFHNLRWRPVLTFEETVKMTVDWYKAYYNDKNIYNYSIKQIIDYVALANEKDIDWIR